MQMGLCARPTPRSTASETCADLCQAYRCLFCTFVSQGTAEADMQKRLCKNVGQKGDAWKKQLATVTGVKYKPGPQQEDAWEDSTGVYDTDGNQLSLEDISDDDNDDAWVDDFGDDTGVIEDKEIFNMDTGWSIQDFEGVVQQPPERQVQHSPCSPLGCSTVQHFEPASHTCIAGHWQLLYRINQVQSCTTMLCMYWRSCQALALSCHWHDPAFCNSSKLLLV